MPNGEALDLLTLRPAQVDQRLAASSQRFAGFWWRNASWRTCPGGFGFESGNTITYNVEGTPPATLAGELESLIELHEAALAPAPRDLLLKELAALRLLTRPRREDADDLAFQLQVYVERLQRHAADAAVAAVRSWPNGSPWWPAWHELLEVIEPHEADRRARLRALDTMQQDMRRRAAEAGALVRQDGTP